MDNTKHAPNINAVQTVYAALEVLDVDARDRVLRAVAALFGTTHQVASSSPTAAPSGTQLRTSTSGNDDIATFIKAKRPADTYQRLACLAYFLDRRADLRAFGAKDLIQANTDARQSKMSNPSVFISRCISSHGYFAPCGAGKSQLTTRGEAVVEAMPDQSAVEKAKAENPMTGNAKSRKARAKT